MKVIKLKAINIKKVKEMEIVPNGNLVLVSGKNGQGKSSILDCLLYALAGKREIPGMPVRQGEDHGSIELDLGDLKVIRSFTENDSYLRVMNKDGAEYPNAQQKLTELVRSIYFDPLQFSLLSAKEQKEALLKLVGVNILDEEIDHMHAYEERTMIGRSLKTAEGELAALPIPEKGDRKLQKYDVAANMAEKDRLQVIATKISNKETEVNSAKSVVADLEARLASAKEIVKAKASELAEIRRENPGVNEKIGKLTDRINEADGVNAKVESVARYDEAVKKVDGFKEQYNAYSQKLVEIADRKNAKLKAAKMPVEGLSVSDEGVTYNGIPFEQISKSEQIRVSLGIAMAQDTGLKLIRIMDGSLLDSDNLSAVEAMANAKDYQVWIEIVDDSGDIGFYVEDGAIAKVN